MTDTENYDYDETMYSYRSSNPDEDGGGEDGCADFGCLLFFVLIVVALIKYCN